MTSGLLLLVCLLCVAVSQPAFPARPYGVVLSNGAPPNAPEFVSWMDIECPDSRAAFPTFLELVSAYGDKIRFRHVLFPLVFHRQSYLANNAMLALLKVSGDDSYVKIVQAGFANQPTLHSVSNNFTVTDVYENIYSNVASGVAPTLSYPDFLTAIDDTSLSLRGQWKGAIREAGVYGTPFYAFNGLPLEPQGVYNAYSLSQWKAFFASAMQGE